MPEVTKYTIFKTGWGYFGLVGNECGLLRTHLPSVGREKVRSQLLKNLPNPQYDKAIFKTVQEQITAYFEGVPVDSGLDIPIVLDGFSRFAERVLSACRDIEFGRTISYSRLAKKIGRPTAARAVGGALAKNPLPLIIPCHRVICSNGKIGGFTAAGGVTLKKRMLELEQGTFSTTFFYAD